MKNNTKSPKWKRLNEITEKEDILLQKTVDNTKGMVRYGNRARTAVMLPCDVAIYISSLSEIEQNSVGQTIVNIIKDRMNKK